jgi:hypothetical protein
MWIRQKQDERDHYFWFEYVMGRDDVGGGNNVLKWMLQTCVYYVHKITVAQG